MASGPITSWQMGKKWKILLPLAPKSLQMVTAAMKLEDACYDKTRQCIKTKRHHFADKGLYSQNCFFPPVVTYECESWTVKKSECPRTDAFKLWC